MRHTQKLSVNFKKHENAESCSKAYDNPKTHK